MQTTLFFDSSKGCGSSDKFTVDFNPPIALDENKNYSIGLVSADIWYSWYNITNNNNKFRYHNGKEWKNLEILPGSYNVPDINNELLRMMREQSDYDTSKDKPYINVTENLSTSRTRIEIRNGYKVDFTIENSLRSIFGFKTKQLTTNGFHDSDNNADITNVQTLLIHCSLVTSSYLNGSSSDIIYAFNVDKPPGYLISIMPFKVFHQRIQNVSQISAITLTVTDQDNRRIDFNGEKVTYYLHLKED